MASKDTSPVVLANLLAFFRGLRQLGFQLSSEEEALALRALLAVGVDQAQDAYVAVRAVVARNRAQLALFDTAWRQFLLLLTRSGDDRLAHNTLLANVARMRRHKPAAPHIVWMGRTDRPSAAEPDEAADTQRVAVSVGASREEVLRHTDFARLTADEQAEMGHLADFVRPLVRRSRRTRPSRHGRAIDLAAVVQQDAKGGAFRLPRRQRRARQRPVVLLCDISGSMDPYSRMIIRFAYAVMQRGVHMETYVFSTRLTRITQALRVRDADKALDEVAAMAPDFSGGTRLAEALQSFCTQDAKRMLQQGAIFLLATDGLDTGELRTLGRYTARLARLTHQLIWLNPAFANPDYRPTARGVRVLHGLVDTIVPAHNWASLEALWGRLRAEPSHRPVRPHARLPMDGPVDSRG